MIEIKSILAELFIRDLLKLKEELLAYKNEADIWKLLPGITNTSGNLALHICGNLKYFIGNVLGKTGYIRHREKEFSDKNIPLNILLQNIDETIDDIKAVIPVLTPEILFNEYPVQVLKEKTSTAFFLTHLCTHLNYHLGQVNYHRKMSEN